MLKAYRHRAILWIRGMRSIKHIIFYKNEKFGLRKGTSSKTKQERDVNPYLIYCTGLPIRDRKCLWSTNSIHPPNMFAISQYRTYT
jgi:hypothetical protein